MATSQCAQAREEPLTLLMRFHEYSTSLDEIIKDLYTYIHTYMYMSMLVWLTVWTWINYEST